MENAPLINQAVANIVRELRRKSCFTQEQLAGFSKTSRSQIAQLEAGKRGVTLHSLYWIAESCNIPFDDFLNMIVEERHRLNKK